MNSTNRVSVVYGILGITFFYFGCVQGVALNGFDFGDLPLLYGELAGFAPVFAGGFSALLLRAALFRKNGGQ